MDTNRIPDNHIASLLHSHTALFSGAVVGVRAQEQQQQEEQQQMLSAQRFLEVGTG